jgi:hypothetical protein
MFVVFGEVMRGHEPEVRFLNDNMVQQSKNYQLFYQIIALVKLRESDGDIFSPEGMLFEDIKVTLCGFLSWPIKVFKSVF